MSATSMGFPPALESAIAEELAGHTAEWTTWGENPEESDYYRCFCEKVQWHVNTSADYYQAHAAHLAEVVRAVIERHVTYEARIITEGFPVPGGVASTLQYANQRRAMGFEDIVEARAAFEWQEVKP